MTFYNLKIFNIFAEFGFQKLRIEPFTQGTCFPCT